MPESTLSRVEPRQIEPSLAPKPVPGSVDGPAAADKRVSPTSSPDQAFASAAETRQAQIEDCAQLGVDAAVSAHLGTRPTRTADSGEGVFPS